MTEPTRPTVVLIHGAFADASGFSGIIRELARAGYSVVAPPNPLRSLASDAAAVSAVVRAIDGPAVLVGHSYGGAVITQASAGLDNVSGLVYLAAFGLERGRELRQCAGAVPAVAGRDCLLSDVVRRAGRPAGTGPLYQRRISSARLSARMCPPTSPMSCSPRSARCRWRRLPRRRPRRAGEDRPCWFLVSEHDNAIAPDAERFMAERMKATTDSIERIAHGLHRPAGARRQVHQEGTGQLRP